MYLVRNDGLTSFSLLCTPSLLLADPERPLHDEERARTTCRISTKLAEGAHSATWEDEQDGQEGRGEAEPEAMRLHTYL